MCDDWTLWISSKKGQNFFGEREFPAQLWPELALSISCPKCAKTAAQAVLVAKVCDTTNQSPDPRAHRAPASAKCSPHSEQTASEISAIMWTHFHLAKPTGSVHVRQFSLTVHILYSELLNLQQWPPTLSFPKNLGTTSLARAILRPVVSSYLAASSYLSSLLG